MRSKLFLGMFLASLGAAALGSTACGGDTTEGGSGGTGGSTSSSSSSSSSGSTSSSSSSGSTSSSSSSSSGTVLPDGCGDTLATAVELTPNDGQGAQCQLPDPTADVRVFKFAGLKGQIVNIQTDAKPTSAEFDPTYLDLVVTLVDSQDKQLAQNDDPPIRGTNDSTIYTVLPADGDYYIKVEECSKVFGTMSCSPADQILTFDFAIGVGTIDPAVPADNPNFTFEGAAANDTTATAQPVAFAKNTNGQYYISQIVGGFSAAADVDVYEVDVPADFSDPAGPESYPTATFMPLMWGTDAMGSTAPIGALRLVDSANLTKSVALLDYANAGDPVGLDIVAPITLGHTYYLFVQRPTGATAGANDFYFVWNYGGTSNPLEQDEAGNNAAAGAEALADAMNPNFLAQYFIEGDLDTGDVDHFSFTVPTGAKLLAVSCGAQRSGSGVRGLTWTVLNVNGATATEAVDTNAFKQDMDISGVAAGTNLTVRLDAKTAPDANVTSRFYRCGIALSAE